MMYRSKIKVVVFVTACSIIADLTEEEVVPWGIYFQMTDTLGYLTTQWRIWDESKS